MLWFLHTPLDTWLDLHINFRYIKEESSLMEFGMESWNKICCETIVWQWSDHSVCAQFSFVWKGHIREKAYDSDGKDDLDEMRMGYISIEYDIQFVFDVLLFYSTYLCTIEISSQDPSVFERRLGIPDVHLPYQRILHFRAYSSTYPPIR